MQELLEMRVRREKMIEFLTKTGNFHPQVLEIMGKVPRHIFFDSGWGHLAYVVDKVIHLPNDVSVSKPYTVAQMTTAAIADRVVAGKNTLGNVLEIGSGSGYQSAILSYLGTKVTGVERIQLLAKQASQRLRELKLNNVVQHWEDGTNDKYLPSNTYDSIVVSAGIAQIPQLWLDALTIGGHLIVPVGDQTRQNIIRYSKTKTGISQDMLQECMFVPVLKGKQKG